MCAPSVKFVGVRFDHLYERLSDTFSNFDGEHYKRAIRRFEEVIHQISEKPEDRLFEMRDIPSDAATLGAKLWPDKSLSFQIGPVLAGVTETPVATLDLLFERMVASQYTRRKTEKRSDDDIWKVYQRPLTRQKVNRFLEPKKVVTDKVEVKFDHAFKNERWHILQPISLDLVRKESIQKKAAQWLGTAMAIKDDPEVGTLYLLLGSPSTRSASHLAAYKRAIKLLEEMPIQHTLVEEDQADTFARNLAEEIERHKTPRRNE
jgi:hypothetical protein